MDGKTTHSMQICLLGKTEVSIAGVPLAFRGKSGLWLLGLLALRANTPVERDWLAGILWPDSAPDTGRANLRRTLTDVRRALGEAASCLEAPTPQTLLLRLEQGEADVLLFRAGNVNAYGGDLMPSCPLEWVENERRVLQEKFLSLGEKQVAVLLPDDALLLLDKLQASAPLRESLLCLRLSALCQMGNRAEAQQAYHDFRRRLLEGRLGEPSPQTQAHWKALQAAPPSSFLSPAQTPAAAPPAAPVPAYALPMPLTACLGRTIERDALLRLLQSHRLVTITGLGGIGKTRLALDAAHAHPNALFIELAEWREVKPLQETLETLLQQNTANADPPLLVLDNFEQLVGPEACRILRRVLEAHPEVHCLITSRRALNGAGEQVFPLEPLEMPEHLGTPARLMEFACVQILMERARAVRPSFTLSLQNAADVVGLCQITEGIPLAIELLAAHLRSMDAVSLLKQVKQTRLPLFARREAGEIARHQSLWRIIESSVAGLTSAEKTGLYLLAAFRGGWDLEAAQAVLEMPLPLAAALLETLVDHALVRFAGGRYYQLETLREYSLAAQTPEIETRARKNHADFFLGVAQKWATPEGLPLLDTERDNLLAAFDTFLGLGNTDSAFALASALRIYWFHRHGGRTVLERLLPLLPPNDAEKQAAVRENLGVLCAMSGDYEAAQSYFADALLHFQHSGDTAKQAQVLSNTAGIAIERGDLTQARVTLEQALPLWRTLNVPRGLGITLTNLSIVLMNQGDLETAALFLDEALQIRTAQNDSYGIAVGLVNRGALEMRRGSHEEAEATFRDALARFGQLGDKRGEASALESIAEAFLNRGLLPEAVRYLQEAAWLKAEYHIPHTALHTDLEARIRTASAGVVGS